MKRRTFLKHSAVASLMLALGINEKKLDASEIPTNFNKTLVNIFLNGGPDFRYLFVPIFSTDTNSYGYTYWNNRANIFGLDPNNMEQIQNYFNANYDIISISNQSFGLLKKADWLKQEIEAGHVAIINNVGGSKSRNHVLSQMVAETGNPDVTQTEGYSHSGWGGRIAQSLNANVISMTKVTRTFAKGAKNSDMYKADYKNIINVNDSRNMGLYYFDTAGNIAEGKNRWKWSDKAVMSRALKSYYEAKRATVTTDSLYYPIFDHEKKLREFGNLIKKRLSSVSIPQLFTDLETQYKGKYGELDCIRQLSGLYDMYNCSDLVNMRVASLDYSGWDTHKHQKSTIETKFELLFGINKGLDALLSSLKNNLINGYENSIFALYGEFGRQLKANGDNGTDHGKGNSVIIIGSSVQGGIYGTLFPKSELDNNDKHSYSNIGADIKPITDMNAVFAQISDWITDNPQSAQTIFPTGSFDAVENGVDFSSLFTST